MLNKSTLPDLSWSNGFCHVRWSPHLHVPLAGFETNNNNNDKTAIKVQLDGQSSPIGWEFWSCSFVSWLLCIQANGVIAFTDLRQKELTYWCYNACGCLDFMRGEKLTGCGYSWPPSETTAVKVFEDTKSSIPGMKVTVTGIVFVFLWQPKTIVTLNGCK